MADAGTAVNLRRHLPETTVLHVGHGLISKNIPGQTYAAADYVCVASPAVAERLSARGHGPRRAFMERFGYDLYAYGGADATELPVKRADCADLPKAMRAEIPSTPGLSSTLLRRRLAVPAG